MCKNCKVSCVNKKINEIKGMFSKVKFERMEVTVSNLSGRVRVIGESGYGMTREDKNLFIEIINVSNLNFEIKYHGDILKNCDYILAFEI